MDVRHLSSKQVQAIHIALMERLGEEPQPLVNPGALDSAVNRVRWAERMEGLSLSALTVRLTIAIALAHAYTDGNKRTAVRSGLVFLRLNGYRLPSNAHALQFAQRLEAYVALGRDERDAEEVRLADWLAETVVPFDPVADRSAGDQ